MEEVDNSLTAYIAKPVEVAYQETEYDASIDSARLPNDAYGMPSGGTWNSGMDFTKKGDPDKPETLYDAWKNDYLWLPSFTETGGKFDEYRQQKDGPILTGFDGIWVADASLKSATPTPAGQYTPSPAQLAQCWLRSGSQFSSGTAVYSLNGHEYFLSNQANLTLYSSSISVNSYLGLRPALHLNLTKANANKAVEGKTVVATPEIARPEYSGALQKAELQDSDIYTVVTNDGGTDVGSYDVVLSLKDQENCVWAETDKSDNLTTQFEIVPRKLDVVWGDKSYTYTGEVQTEMPTATAKGLSEETFTLKVAPLVGDVFKNAGAHTLQASLEESDATKNYALNDTKYHEYTIDKAPVSVTWGEKSYTYNGESQKRDMPTATASGIDGKKLYLTVAPLAGDDFKNAGTHTLQATFSYDDSNTRNYYLDGTAQHAYTIDKAQVDVTWEERTFAFNGATQEYPAATVTGLGSDGVIPLSVAIEPPEAEFKNAGSYTFLASLDEANPLSQNYTLGNGTETTVTMHKALLTLSNFEVIGTMYGDGEVLEFISRDVAFTDVRTGETLTPEAVSEANFKVEVTGKLSAYNAGKQTALITGIRVTGDLENYEISIVGNQTFVEVEIMPAPLTVSLDEDGNPVFSGFVNGEGSETLGGKLNVEYTQNADGTYTAHLSGLESENYTITYLDSVVREASANDLTWLYATLGSVGGALLLVAAAFVLGHRLSKKASE